MARILIVDDDPSLASVPAQYFRMAGHTPLPAPTGHAALCAAQAHPDVILLDLGLPDMAGDEVLRRLKRDPATAPIPVVIVSGEPDAADRVSRDETSGAVAVLQKPVDGAALCAVVDFVLVEQEADTPDASGAGRGPRYPRHRDLVARWLSRGSESLIDQVYRRLVADRTCPRAPAGPPPPSWQDLARAAQQEGLLNDGEGALLATYSAARSDADGPTAAPRVG